MTTPLVHLLLVEDNAGDARLIRALLDEAGPGRFEVQHEETLRGALAHLRSAEPDAVLLDLELPDERGVETVARLTAAAPQLPIVVLTGTTDEQIAARAMEHGAQDYLVKGRVDGAGLVRALRHALSRKRAVETGRRLAEERASRIAAEALARRFGALCELIRALTDAAELKAAHQAAAGLIAAEFGGACAIDVETARGPLRWIEAGAPDARASLAASAPERAVRAPPTGLLVEDTGASPERVESLCAVPLSVRGQRLGAVVVATRGARLTTGDLGFLRELSWVLSLAVDAARLGTGGTFSG